MLELNCTESDMPVAVLERPGHKRKREEAEASAAVRQYVSETNWHRLAGKSVGAIRQDLMKHEWSGRTMAEVLLV